MPPPRISRRCTTCCKWSARPPPRTDHPMRGILRRAAAALMAALRVAAGAMLIASVAINFANIIGRYFLSVSLSWAEEAMLFLMIGAVFLAAAPVGWQGRHIRMDVIVSLLPPRARKIFDMLAELDQRSASANIPLVIPQAALPLGLLLMALLIAVRLIVQGVRYDDVI